MSFYLSWWLFRLSHQHVRKEGREDGTWAQLLCVSHAPMSSTQQSFHVIQPAGQWYLHLSRHLHESTSIHSKFKNQQYARGSSGRTGVHNTTDHPGPKILLITLTCKAYPWHVSGRWLWNPPSYFWENWHSMKNQVMSASPTNWSNY